MTDGRRRPEIVSGDEPDSVETPLHIEEGAIFGLAETEDLIAREQALREQLAGTMRAVLSERMVRAPTEEYEAVQLPGKAALAKRREQLRAADKPRSREVSTARVKEARSRLNRGTSSKDRTDGKPR